MDEPAETGTASKDCIFSSTKNCLILKSHFVQWQWQEKAEPDGPRTAATSSSGCEDSTFFFKRWRLNLFFFLCDCECELGCPPLHPKWVQFPSLGHGFGNPVHLLNFDFLPYFFRRKSKQAVERRTAHQKKGDVRTDLLLNFGFVPCFWQDTVQSSSSKDCIMFKSSWLNEACNNMLNFVFTSCWQAQHIVLKSTPHCAEKHKTVRWKAALLLLDSLSYTWLWHPVFRLGPSCRQRPRSEVLPRRQTRHWPSRC